MSLVLYLLKLCLMVQDLCSHTFDAHKGRLGLHLAVGPELFFMRLSRWQFILIAFARADGASAGVARRGTDIAVIHPNASRVGCI